MKQKIGVISDTHGYIDQGILEFLDRCDEIWHAGDIGNPFILRKLEELAPVRAVYGNIDGMDIRAECPWMQAFDCKGLSVLMVHIGGKPGKYQQEALEHIRQKKPGLFICGHSHILKIQYDKQHGMLFVNPGAAGKSGFHKVRTALRFEVEEKEIKNMEVYEIDPKKS